MQFGFKFLLDSIARKLMQSSDYHSRCGQSKQTDVSESLVSTYPRIHAIGL
eukprot:COSAG02_NODE_825_length_16730_cov_58.738260_8_plen_51_part_00